MFEFKLQACCLVNACTVLFLHSQYVGIVLQISGVTYSEACIADVVCPNPAQMSNIVEMISGSNSGATFAQYSSVSPHSQSRLLQCQAQGLQVTCPWQAILCMRSGGHNKIEMPSKSA